MKVIINGQEKEAEFVNREGDYGAHWEVDGEDFDGHFHLWSFSFEPKTYLKESEISGDQWRKGGSIKIMYNGICVMDEFHRDPTTAPVRIHSLLQDCMQVDWDRIEVGLKVYYKDHPCHIARILHDGELILETDNGEDFPLWAFQKENKEEAENREWTNDTKVHASSKDIYWWRK